MYDGSDTIRYLKGLPQYTAFPALVSSLNDLARAIIESGKYMVRNRSNNRYVRVALDAAEEVSNMLTEDIIVYHDMLLLCSTSYRLCGLPDIAEETLKDLDVTQCTAHRKDLIPVTLWLLYGDFSEPIKDLEGPFRGVLLAVSDIVSGIRTGSGGYTYEDLKKAVDHFCQESYNRVEEQEHIEHATRIVALVYMLIEEGKVYGYDRGKYE